ncbi:MAG TPA: glycosyltransferase family 4 protein [Micromonosporaceae bacterium]|nr:glycosyltransferase family 4 protein [Micromonosporaceae bacterium]
MKVAQVTAPFEPVPPVGYGGVERVVAALVEGCVAAGDSVTLYATGDSVTSARLVAAYPAPVPVYDWYSELYGCVGAWTDPAGVDLVHNHSRAGFLFAAVAAASSGVPTVHTLHGHLESRQMSRIYRRFADLSYVSVSLAQQRLIPELSYVANIYNGVDVDTLRPDPARSRDYLLSIGVVAPRKGVHTAVRVAVESGSRLVVVGRVPDRNRAYFDSEVAPFVDGDLVRFVGEVGGADRPALFQGARALLCPLEWEEPFGLVMAEALACGVPVIAFDRGSAAEVVSHGETGFVVSTPDEMVAALADLPKIDPAACRDRAVAHFGSARMVSEYRALYATLASG